MAKRPCLIFAIGCGAFACILQIVGVATPSWYFTEEKNVWFPLFDGSWTVGLWRACNSKNRNDGEICFDLDSPAGYIHATRAFGILAILAMAVAVAADILVVLNDKMADMIVVAAAMFFAGALSSLLAVGIFAANAVEGAKFRYSFGVCIVAAILAGVSGGISIACRVCSPHNRVK